MTRNGELAGAALGHLLALGVENFVVCAGARNAPLVTSLLAVTGSRRLTLWPYFDERTASFFALGLARACDRPVAVLTTSGTAVAELLPATVEAYYTSVPLILVTADRPKRFRGSGAPQAIEQANLFGPYTTESVDAENPDDLSWLVRWKRRGPLHLNVCFEEPAAEDQVTSIKTVVYPAADPISHGYEGDQILEFVNQQDKLIVLLGAMPESWIKPVERFLHDLGIPVWAEATSGLRESEKLLAQRIRGESRLIDLEPGAVLRIGGVPSLRYWRDLESMKEVPVLSVAPHPFAGLARDSGLILCDPFPDIEGASQQGWVHHSTLSDDLLDEVLRKHPRSEPAMVEAISDLIPESAMIFLGNSLPIREWNLAASTRKKHPHCLANRGANGIDGEVASFFGLSYGFEESWGIFGDLTALYDLNAPGLLSQLPDAKRRIVVLNNGGGRIFSRLPSMARLSAEEKAVTENHHRQRFEHWAEMWQMNYVCWRAGHAAPKIEGKSVLIEVLLENRATESFWADLK
ncbi:MAG: 2-succinyl-5-enolpyruvyl-6-hydroxy-3-cyclohexene-1-carboxylic-acid synthase [Verrucomicrobiota bacterium]